MYRKLGIMDREAHAIEECLIWHAYPVVYLELGGQRRRPACLMVGNNLDKFRRDFDDSWAAAYPDLAREFEPCRAVIVVRPSGQLIVYGSHGVSYFYDLWDRLQQNDLGAIDELNTLTMSTTTG